MYPLTLTLVFVCVNNLPCLDNILDDVAMATKLVNKVFPPVRQQNKRSLASHADAKSLELGHDPRGKGLVIELEQSSWAPFSLVVRTLEAYHM